MVMRRRDRQHGRHNYTNHGSIGSFAVADPEPACAHAEFYRLRDAPAAGLHDIGAVGTQDVLHRSNFLRIRSSMRSQKTSFQL